MNYKNCENDNFRQNLKKEFLKFDITNVPLYVSANKINKNLKFVGQEINGKS